VTGRLGIPSLQSLALMLLVAISYLPALEAGFVRDDVIFVEERVVHEWSGLWNIWFSPADIESEDTGPHSTDGAASRCTRLPWRPNTGIYPRYS